MEAPDEYNLKSDIHSGIRPSGWVFDPYLGRRILPGSEKIRYEALRARLESRLEVYHKVNP